jgi:S-DNA-T family DNA segregation ATPase FtsK/SpoIIIE
MIFEVTTSLIAGGIASYSYFQKKGGSNDAIKIQRICASNGLTVKENGKTKTMQLLRRTRHSWGTEYAYRIPLGLSFKDFENKRDHLQDGLNNKSAIIDITINDLKSLKLDRNPLQAIKTLLDKKKKLRKEIELSYDGVLKIRVYDELLPALFKFDESLFTSCNGWEIPIGITQSDLIKHDFEVTPHMGIGGATRYGKSNFLNMLITFLIHKHGDNVSFTLVDLKGGVEFSDYEDIKQVKRIAYEPEEALDALKAAYEDMRSVQQRLKKMGKKKVQDTSIKSRHFVIIDEVGELNPDEAIDKKDIRKEGILIHKSEKTIKEECQQYMSKIARLGAGLGFRQILATQYPTGDVIPRQCKQNSDAKLCFRVRNATASRVVLDEEGAEKLPLIKGRAIYQTDQKTIVQTPFIESEFIEKTIQPHINIRPRKERVETIEKRSGTPTEGRKHMLIVEETGLS